MDDFQGLLARDFGLRPQGKAAPMSAARSSSPSGSAWTNTRSAVGSAAPSAPSYDELFGSAPPPPPKATPSLDNIFNSFKEPASTAPPPKPKHSSAPVFDKPVYDDDIFIGVPGVKSSSVPYDDVFGGSQSREAPPAFDDLLGGFGKSSQVREEVDDKRKPEAPTAVAATGFDYLIPSFGGRSSPRQRDAIGAKQKKVSMSTSKQSASLSDPFVVLETTSSSAHPFADPLDESGKAAKYQGKNRESTSVGSSLFEDSSTFNQAPKFEPFFTPEVDNGSKDRNESSRAQNSNPVQDFSKRNSSQQPSVEDFENIFPKSQSARYSDVHVDIGSEKYSGNGINDQSPRSDESEDEIWLTASEIPLFTQPTSAPPPSRPPPPLAVKQKHGSRSTRKDEHLRRSRKNNDHQRSFSNQAGVSTVDGLEDFTMGKSQNVHTFNEEEFERSTAAAAMKEAMDKAEAKFKHAKEVRERERDAKLRNREQQERDNVIRSYAQDREDKERNERLEQEREMKQKEEKEREQRRLEEERELERHRERERARQAVERATKEARERAASEARAKAEREARKRSERAAVQRAQQEARERAAADAKDRAERATAEANERAATEAKEKAASQARDRAAAEKAAVERAQQEVRKRAERAAVERAAAEARERQAAAAAAAREKTSKPDDLESLFGMGARANSAPKQRAPTVDSMFDSQTQNRGTSTSTSMKKASSTANVADDLSALFGGAPTSSNEFQEVDGESEERRRARLERHQRTRERAAKALAEKNERDMQQQRDQAERHRLAETLDFEIKRWAAGKEGNLRALLSTLQYVLWPECGWQPVSLTDLITAAAVKKVYRKATLCIHPDKVQQKGANLQQKYIAEKVFDLLKVFSHLLLSFS
ncbi:Auxilin-related protein 1 [Zea mays]|uniref:Auxilin-related protein 1 n=1 Tax=Zea mays TaxID=4577 RepID=A0A1D6IW82_MAIZE|nr:Auxilin-related protein 1 [Zea mays]